MKEFFINQKPDSPGTQLSRDINVRYLDVRYLNAGTQLLYCSEPTYLTAASVRVYKQSRTPKHHSDLAALLQGYESLTSRLTLLHVSLQGVQRVQAILLLLTLRVEIKKQVLYLQIWRDPKLTWDPIDYGGLERISVPSHMVWLPDIVLFDR